MKKLILVSLSGAFILAGHSAFARAMSDASCGQHSAHSLEKPNYNVAELTQDKKKASKQRLGWKRNVTRERK